MIGFSDKLLVSGVNHEARVSAQPQTLRQSLHHFWTTENGLPQNSVNAIVQTRDGYLWLGTHGGLARFDGVNFTLFDTGNTPALRSSRIAALYEDRAGNLWIGTQYGGLSRYAQGRFATWTTKDGLPNDGVLSLCEDREGTLWIGTHNGLARMSGGRLTAFASRFSGPVDQLRATNDGSLWFASGGAVNRWRAGEATSYPIINGLPVGQVYGIREAPDGSLWIAMDRGLFRFQGGAFSTILSYPVWTADRLPPELVFQIYADRERNLCFLTPRGVARFTAGRIVTAELAGFSSLVELTTEKLPRVFSVSEDREGNLWVGTGARGLHQFSLAPITAYAAEQGLANGSFVVITEDMQGGMWLGCGSGCGANGLFRFYAGKFTAYPFKSVWALHQSPDGSLWIGDDRGLHQFTAFSVWMFSEGQPRGARGRKHFDQCKWVSAGDAPALRRGGSRWPLPKSRRV